MPLSSLDFFFDGPLGDLDGVTPGISPIASGSLNEILGSETQLTFPQSGLSDEQIAKVKSVVDDAHSRGLLTRIWEAPLWTNKLKLNVWEQLIDLGSDFLNADDLEQAASL
ncbi:unnamed protein product [Ambrosiozyma monospora]|uniref:Unnamed protein product n=1 Tax=Ambrosiozyma monospora TaxID=43982 RepID=A0ACB5TJT2_AMBMO|nr:unnamed protein product [Ambrosiozyma monospora]